ncbi:MAG: hypothetical protein AB1393_04570 [Candidatus Edwardsbacteria bacterium]
MEYKVLTCDDPQYPKKLKERLGSECPSKLYYWGPLKFLDIFTMAVISADSIGGIAYMAANQVLFTIRDYAMNYIGPHYSVMEHEIFRLGLWKKCHNTVTLFTAKGLAVESYGSFLLDRFYPPFDKFPEREEYFRRAQDHELLMLSVAEPNQTRQIRKSIMERNWIACNLGDIVFVPYGVKGSKTYTMCKRIVKAGNIPIFTTDSEQNKDLHQLGIPAYNRKTVKGFLEKHGVKLWTSENDKNTVEQEYAFSTENHSYGKKHTQLQMEFLGKNKKLKK